MPLNLPPPKSAAGPQPTSGPSGSALPAAATNGGSGRPSSSIAGASSSHVNSEASTSGSVGSSSSSFTSKLGLPPPKTKSKQAAANQPKKFVLDLPKATRSASELEDGHESVNGSDEPASKKPRTGGGGLSALLPQPKKAAGLGGLNLPEPKKASTAPESSKPATSMIPHTLKGKNKIAENPLVQAEKVAANGNVTQKSQIDDEEQADEEEPDNAVLDFFGLGAYELAALLNTFMI